MNLAWLIIGGGIHGVHIAARLLSETDLDRGQVRIVDPGEDLLERWHTCTETTGMKHLRSPAVHHLDRSPWSLMNFADDQEPMADGLFAPPFNRPNLNLFNAHCQQVIETYELNELHLRARATVCAVDCDGVEVQLSNGLEVKATNIVLAVGSGERPELPAWAPQNEARVQHVFAANFDAWPTTKEAVLVVGGGISAGQVALRLIEEEHQVHLVSRHALREHQFDSAPGWLGPKFMTGFAEEQDVDKRRALITGARNKGSVPPDVHDGLNAAIESGQLIWHQAQVDSLDAQNDALMVGLTSGALLDVQRVLLATGFESRRPGGALVDGLVDSAALPCAQCGYPIVDTSLRWHPGIYVSGPLAELELGPAARNIAGARRAAERLVRAILRSKQTVRKKAS